MSSTGQTMDQATGETTEKTTQPAAGGTTHPSDAQYAWLSRGLKQPGGKLPLFDELGQQVSERTVRSCIDKGWAEPWFSNPLKPDWIVCKLTELGRAVVQQ